MKIFVTALFLQLSLVCAFAQSEVMDFEREEEELITMRLLDNTDPSEAILEEIQAETAETRQLKADLNTEVTSLSELNEQLNRRNIQLSETLEGLQILVKNLALQNKEILEGEDENFIHEETQDDLEQFRCDTGDIVKGFSNAIVNNNTQLLDANRQAIQSAEMLIQQNEAELQRVLSLIEENQLLIEQKTELLEECDSILSANQKLLRFLS